MKECVVPENRTQSQKTRNPHCAGRGCTILAFRIDRLSRDQTHTIHLWSCITILIILSSLNQTHDAVISLDLNIIRRWHFRSTRNRGRSISLRGSEFLHGSQNARILAWRDVPEANAGGRAGSVHEILSHRLEGEFSVFKVFAIFFGVDRTL